MKKKFIGGMISILILVSMPFTQLKLTSDVASEPAESTVLYAAAPPEAPPAESGNTYTLSIPSSIGTLTYYNQYDARWADFLYGNRDPLGRYGCGPTVLAMLVTSFTEQTVLPSDMAAWAAANNYWSPGAGTAHSFIPEGAAAFGFSVQPFLDYTDSGIRAALESGYILVALMGPGQFTSSGHFIIVTDYWSGNQVSVADPANLDNTLKPWDIQLILNEVSRSANSGGPIWMIAPK